MRITFEEFKAFADLQRRLELFAMAIFSYGKINGLLTKQDLKRVASHGQCIYRMLCNGSGSTQVIRKKRFPAMINGLKRCVWSLGDLRYWSSKLVSEKASIVIAMLYLSWSLKVSYDMYAARRTVMAYLDDKERNADIRDVHKKAA